ncbi:MAG: DUF5688 family protein [Lachnospiraceae bacterium]|nr:DUF5688 family protein [Lachnospiraceae bacterium]
MNEMNFDEFKQAIVDNIKDYLPAKFEESDVEVRQVLKNNDTVLDGLIIHDPDTNVAPTIYLNLFFEEYQNGRDLNDIIGDIADVYIANTVDKQMDISIVTDFEKAKGNILPRLVNAEENQELLAQRPHMIMDDLAVTYHLEMGKSDNGNMSVAITNTILDMYGISQEELHDLAVANLEEKVPATFQGMSEVVKEMMLPQIMSDLDLSKEAALDYIEKMIPDGNEQMYVLSNDSRLNGAAAVLNEKAMEDIAEKVGGDFFILPSSIHELLVVPKQDGMELSDLEAMVQEVNATQVAPEEKLSDHVYEYDAKEKELYRADKADEHEQKVEQKHAKEKGAEKEKVSIKDKLSQNKEKATEINKSHEKNHEKKKEVML